MEFTTFLIFLDRTCYLQYHFKENSVKKQKKVLAQETLKKRNLK